MVQSVVVTMLVSGLSISSAIGYLRERRANRR